MSDTVIWLGIWALILWGIGHLRLNLLVRRWTKIIFLPGVALEAFVRMLACFATGTPIEKFRPFADGQPFLRTGRCPVERIGVPITMAIRMMLTWFFALVLLKLTVPAFTECGFELPTFLYHREGIQGSGGGYLGALPELPYALQLDTVIGWFAVYTLFALALATGLSAREFFAAIWGWGGVLGLTYLVSWLGVRLEFMSRGWFLRSWYLPECWAAFSLLVTLSAIALLFLMGLHSLPNMATKIKPKPTSAPQGLAVERH